MEILLLTAQPSIFPSSILVFCPWPTHIHPPIHFVVARSDGWVERWPGCVILAKGISFPAKPANSRMGVRVLKQDKFRRTCLHVKNQGEKFSIVKNRGQIMSVMHHLIRWIYVFTQDVGTSGWWGESRTDLFLAMTGASTV